MDAQLLAHACGISVSRAERWTGPLTAAMDLHDIDTPARQAAFLAQVGHESMHFVAVQENLNYSAQALCRVWPRRFRMASAGEDGAAPQFADGKRNAAYYGRHPERIANAVYSDRMGNGDEASGDGWQFRGRGLIQITGKENYRSCSMGLFGDTRLLLDPQMLESDEHAALSAAWFWQARGLNELADAGDMRAITRKINGGGNGLQERLSLWEQAKQALRGEA